MPSAQIVMFVYNNITHDARVWREARALRDAGHPVCIIALQTGALPADEIVDDIRVLRVAGGKGSLPGAPSPFRGKARGSRVGWLVRYGRALSGWRKAAAEAANGVRPELPVILHGHDLTGLAAAYAAASRRPGPVIYDSHELFTEAGSPARLPKIMRWLLAKYERRLARRAAAVITVNESIAIELEMRYGVPRPTVVMNCPPLGSEPIDPASSPLRTTFDLGTRPTVLHHGRIADGRGIMETVRALDYLSPEFALVLLGDGELVPVLERLAEDAYPGRLFLHGAVRIESLPNWLAGADVGVIAFQAINKNNYYGTPNKLFECLASGVPAIVSDFPEMRRVVEAAGAGAAVPPTVEGIAAGIRHVLQRPADELKEGRRRCRAIAESRYSWEQESRRLLDVYRQVEAADL